MFCYIYVFVANYRRSDIEDVSKDITEITLQAD
jgi:hypothetical protein